MARKQLEQYLNQLDIKKGEFLEKQRKEYKFSRFQHSLEMLDRASNHHTIPEETLSEIELIFDLMPSHELYYIKKDEVQFNKYIKEVNNLFIKVLDNYEEYGQEWISTFKKIMNIFFPVIYMLIFFHDKLQKWIGLPFTIILILISALLLLYMNRKQIWNNPAFFS